jgi:hypothetical protein
MGRYSLRLKCVLILTAVLMTAAFLLGGTASADTNFPGTSPHDPVKSGAKKLPWSNSRSSQASDWVRQDFPSDEFLWGVFALDENHVWVGGEGAIWFFNGMTWTRQYSSSYYRVTGIWGSDSKHVWAVGPNKTILSFNGNTWSVQFTGGAAYSDICGLDASHVWACGEHNVASFDGSSWTDTVTPGATLNAISAHTPSDVWAVGGNACVIRFNGSLWSTVTPPDPTTWYWGVDAIDATHVWVAGASQKGPFFFNGVSWQPFNVTDSTHWRTICSRATDDVWFVSYDAVFHYNGSSFSKVGSSIEGGLEDLSLAKDGGKWLVGGIGDVYTLTKTVPPKISECFPTRGAQGQMGYVQIMGSDTHFEDGVSKATFSGSGITVGETIVLSETEAAAFITIDNDAPIGARDVNVITGSERPKPLKGGFTVTYPTYYFAEGTCRPGFDPYICIQNPYEEGPDAEITITYMKGDGETVTDQVTVASHSRVTVNPKNVLGEGDDPSHDFSTVLQCTNGLSFIAERPMYFNYGASSGLNWNGGHDVIGAGVPAQAFGFAEGTCRPGFETYFCILNPNETAADVSVIYMLGNGKLVNQHLTVDAHSRATARAKDALGEGDDSAHDFSALVGANNELEIVVERPMYFNYTGGQNRNWNGGSNVMGTAYASNYFFFAEGTCRPGFDPYLCIQNPYAQGPDAEVTITYMKGDGETVDEKVKVAAHSRVTVNPKNVLGEGDDPSHDFSTIVHCTNRMGIVAERPMYFNYGASSGLNWNGGHDVIGADYVYQVFGFAEGTCRPGFETYFCILNPNETDADVTVIYMLGNGEIQEQDLTVDAHSRATVTAKEMVGEGDDSAHDFSALVGTNNDLDIVVERPMYFNYTGGQNRNWTGGSDVVGY